MSNDILCEALSKKTKERCKNRKSSGSKFCSQHNEKIETIESLNRKSFTNILMLDYPEIYNEIDFDNPFNPNIEELKKLKVNNSKLIFWKCSKSKCHHHIYQNKVNSRVKFKNGCPFCSHHQTCICDSIINTHPHISNQFITLIDIEKYKDQKYYFKVFKGILDNKRQWEIKEFDIYDIVKHNQNFDLTKTIIGSNPNLKIGEIKGVFWKCTNNQNKCLHHIWDANFIDRKNSDGCPFCSIPLQRVCLCNSIVSQKYFNEFDSDNVNNPKIDSLKEISKNSLMVLWWKCFECQNSWSTNCYNRTNGKNCSFCADMILKMKKKVNNDKFDYSLFKYKNANTKGIIICKEHNETFEDNYTNHIKIKGCKKCILDRINIKQKSYGENFIRECQMLFQNAYDYNSFNYVNTNTQGKIYCKKCEKFFMKTPEHHKNRKEGCPTCTKSSGELNIINVLKKMNIEYSIEYKIPNITELLLKRFDFFIEYNRKKILIEFDGRQHFIFLDIFHRDYDEFLERRNIDILKTILPLQNNYNVIRISHLEFNKIDFHLKTALEHLDKGNIFYFSNNQLYKWIYDKIEEKMSHT